MKFDFLSVLVVFCFSIVVVFLLVVRGGTVCLPTPPSWPEAPHSCFIQSVTDGHLGSFHILVIVNNASMNKGVLMFFQMSVLGSLGYILRSGIAGLKGRSTFNFLRCLHSGCTNLHSQALGFFILCFLKSIFLIY